MEVVVAGISVADKSVAAAGAASVKYDRAFFLEFVVNQVLPFVITIEVAGGVKCRPAVFEVFDQRGGYFGCHGAAAAVLGGVIFHVERDTAGVHELGHSVALGIGVAAAIHGSFI